MTKRRKLQINLRWLAFLVMALAVALGWNRDHHETKFRLERLPGDIAVLDGQIHELTIRMIVPNRPVSQERFIQAMQLNPISDEVIEEFPASAELYLQQLEQVVERLPDNPFDYFYGRFFPAAIPIYRAPDPEFDKAVIPLLEYSHSQVPGVADAAMRVVRTLIVEQPERMSPHAATLVPHLIKCLDSPRTDVRFDAIACLKVLGPKAGEGLDPLRKIMDNDKDDFAVFAALAVAKIDPEAPVGERLMELIRNRRGQFWHYAAQRLTDVVAPEEAKTFFREQYLGSQEELWQLEFARLINDVSLPRNAQDGEPR